MRKILLLTVSLLALCAGPAGAAGINLGWNDCPGGGTYAPNRTFACNTNVGTNTLVGSFVAPSGVVMMSANEIVIDMKSSAVAVPPWWSFATGLCRNGSLSANFDFTAGPSTCYDYSQGGAVGGFLAGTPSGTMMRIKAIWAIAQGDPRITSIPEGRHVYSFKVNISNARTVGTACSGCLAGMCIVLNQITLNQPPQLGQIYLTNPAFSQYAVWQGYPGWGTCPDVTPAKSQTWGSIKALYR